LESRLNLNLLTSFYAVARHGSFTGAADELCLTHSVISKHVKQLEETLDSVLFNRTTRSVSLTEEGAYLYQKCRTIFAEVEEVKSFIDDQRKVVRGRLVVKMPSILKHDDGVNQCLESLHLNHPDLVLEIVFEDKLGDLLREGVDVAFHIGALQDSSYLCRKVRDIGTYVVASPEYLASAGTPQHPNELTQHKCLHYSHCQTGLNWAFREDGKEFKVPISPALSSMSESMLARYACKGFGVTTTLDFVSQNAIDSGLLINFLDSYTWKTELYLVYPNSNKVPLKTRTLIAAMMEIAI
jgi:DNA-binding transcriptional LysR family regulator